MGPWESVPATPAQRAVRLLPQAFLACFLHLVCFLHEAGAF
jgi:hypothetical protein